MKKEVIVALVISISAFSFAQKKELKTAEKAIKSSNFSEAKTALSQAEALKDEMDGKLKAKYYYLNAEALYANGKGSMKDIDAAIESLSKVEGDYIQESEDLKQKMVTSLVTTGNKAYEGKDFSKASNYFEKTYRLSTKDTVYLYYAATMSVSVPEYDRALTLYEELKTLGYTGVAKEYYATNVETGKEEVLDKNTRDLYVKSKTHIKPGERMTESKKPEIVKNIALIYVSQGKDEKALAAMKDARAESPNDVNLILSEANVHYKMGNTAEFKSLLKEAIAMDPKNPELQYNLGVIAAESNQADEAKMYYKKALELDPNYVNAYINLAALILAEEKPLIEEMNGLGTSKKDNDRYDELREKRQELYKEAVPYLSKALEIDETNINAAKTLMNIYSILGETEKSKAMKEKVEALEAAGN
ncbi:tetratricopeptide repeat protein [Tamlana sp. 2_MG-2023]|uniref:tetratricopeptide repeat protein n=1 Tax=unclassified Tamlana TaxID=2614803 RepID=UPI0026E33811|nr:MULTISPECIES: tetratricopeptide repeat protein [unclassified Tamlana]MDO6761573.1 tetratricopeptide repeat protein [Tamlana sp. 2_MG-2023]MDO6792297.1 tetratricopeptide repeat protein [Tamlana sp. 1_MG-2023]